MYSLVNVTLTPNGDASLDATEYLKQYLDVSVVTKRVPCALWGKPVSEQDKNKSPEADQQIIDNALVGVEIKTKAGPRPWETLPLDLEVLAYDRERRNFQWECPTPKQADSFSGKTIANTIMARNVVETRNSILTELRRSHRKIMKAEDIDLEQLSQNAQYIFQDMPAMSRLGQYPPRGYLATI
jgi:hypothetical protein